MKENNNNNNQEINEFNQPIEGISLNRDAWRRLKKNKMAIGGLFIVLFYFALTLIAPLLPLHDPDYIVLDHQHLPPSLTKNAGELLYEKTETRMLLVAEKRQKRDHLNDAEKQELKDLKSRIAVETIEIDGKVIKLHERKYYFGTDYHGRDMLARVIYGGRVSMAIGVLGAVVAMFIGIVYGSIAGYVGGRTDNMMMRFVDIMYGLPYMLIVIIFMALFGRQIYNLFIAIACVAWLFVSRLIRGQIISLKNSEFVEAAISSGASTRRIIFKHMIPNTIGLIIVFTSLEVPRFILLESFLSFLGLGISAPMASWGSLIAEAIQGMEHFPWRLFFPAAAMTLFLFAMNFLGDGLRDAFDPQSKNRI